MAEFRPLGDGTFEGFCPATGQRVRVRAEHQQAFEQECQQHSAKYYQLGDVVARATKALGVPPCSPCQQRRAALNQMFRRR